MEEYIVDLSGTEDRAGLHRCLRRSLPLPEWYGDNLDALYDALTELPGPVRIRVYGWESFADAEPAYMKSLRRLARDARAENPGLEVLFEDSPAVKRTSPDAADSEDSPAAEANDAKRADSPAETASEAKRADGSAVTPDAPDAADSADSPAVTRPDVETSGTVSSATDAAASGKTKNRPQPSAFTARPARILIITDIHGCLDECRALLAKMGLDEETDTLINLGDTIDRGPQIYETFEFLHGLKERMGERCILLRGNHEQMMLDAASTGGRNRDLWYYNKGDRTVWSFHNHGCSFQEYLSWYEDMPLYYTTEKFSCVHASLLDPDPEKNDPDTLLWGRDTNYSGKLVMTGHTPYRAPIYFHGEDYGRLQEDIWTVLPENGMIALDTGCVYGNRLTGMVIRENGDFMVTSVPASVRGRE